VQFSPVFLLDTDIFFGTLCSNTFGPCSQDDQFTSVTAWYWTCLFLRDICALLCGRWRFVVDIWLAGSFDCWSGASKCQRYGTPRYFCFNYPAPVRHALWCWTEARKCVKIGLSCEQKSIIQKYLLFGSQSQVK